MIVIYFYFLQHKCLFYLGTPEGTTKNLEKLKDAIKRCESKVRSKGVPKLELKVKLKKAAFEKGFIVSDNDGGGNCLFHALSEQLSIAKEDPIPHDVLRKTLVQYLKENQIMVGFVWYL